MEAERRSTMSSLKGQLSNVEGSVKSMKVAVVVGSFLTVACLAAVFGVTVLANEVSKEVKVSNGSLTSKSGETVKTSTMEMSNKVTLNSETLFGENASFKINAVVVQGEHTVAICDDYVVIQKDGVTVSGGATEGSVLAAVLGDNVEKRNLNNPLLACLHPLVGYYCAMIISGAITVGKWVLMSILGWELMNALEHYGLIESNFK